MTFEVVLFLFQKYLHFKNIYYKIFNMKNDGVFHIKPKFVAEDGLKYFLNLSI